MKILTSTLDSELPLKQNFRPLVFQEMRSVTQLQYRGWPDHDVPLTTTRMIKLRKLVEAARNKTALTGPIVVHCRYNIEAY